MKTKTQKTEIQKMIEQGDEAIILSWAKTASAKDVYQALCDIRAMHNEDITAHSEAYRGISRIRHDETREEMLNEFLRTTNAYARYYSKITTALSDIYNEFDYDDRKAAYEAANCKN